MGRIGDAKQNINTGEENKKTKGNEGIVDIGAWVHYY